MFSFPVIATSDSDTDAYVYGETVTLFCIVVAGGTPPITFGDWIPPEGSTSLSRGTISDDGSTLTFTALESDTGSFRCSATDSEGETDSGSEEIVVGKQWSCVTATVLLMYILQFQSY